MNVHVQQTNTLTGQRQFRGQIDRDGAFTDAALAGKNNNFIPDAAESGLQFAPIRVFLCAFIFFLFGG